MEGIYCDCGQKLTNKICPNCGSEKKHIKLIFEGKTGLHDQIKGKVRGFRRPVKEFKVGDDLHRLENGIIIYIIYRQRTQSIQG